MDRQWSKVWLHQKWWRGKAVVRKEGILKLYIQCREKREKRMIFCQKVKSTISLYCRYAEKAAFPKSSCCFWCKSMAAPPWSVRTGGKSCLGDAKAGVLKSFPDFWFAKVRRAHLAKACTVRRRLKAHSGTKVWRIHLKVALTVQKHVYKRERWKDSHGIKSTWKSWRVKSMFANKRTPFVCTLAFAQNTQETAAFTSRWQVSGCLLRFFKAGLQLKANTV